ncbi:hypothetical protein DP57_5940 [Burkholderia pseudomallei]|uniref:hypothetical protein n=1 Tax=Burkholderia pseudomallei TaxID=28450 RepID=UPI00050D9E94|nr:hypothetical protein [Burkholderia pseudomallei]KGC70219.1 hypothetical protein DP57_5940 [Burkholderia pseudomallei]
MARRNHTKPPARPVPQYVDGVVFTLAMGVGEAEVIGIPFEYLGRTWAVHQEVGGSHLMGPRYCVSDVEHGRRVPDSQASSVDGARAAAIATLDRVTDTSWVEAFGSARAVTVE